MVLCLFLQGSDLSTVSYYVSENPSSHVLFGMDAECPAYIVSINGIWIDAHLDTIYGRTRWFEPPYGYVINDTTGIVSFAIPDSVDGGWVMVDCNWTGIDSIDWPDTIVVEPDELGHAIFYNVAGQKVHECYYRDEDRDTISFIQLLKANPDVASGVYFAKLIGKTVAHRKILIIR